MKKIEIKHIYWFAYFSIESPSVRYRAQYPLEYFKKKHGTTYHLVTPSYTPKGLFIFFKAFFHALFFRKKNSLIIIQRIHSNFIYAKLLSVLLIFRKKNTVYDLDDANYLEFPTKKIYHFAKNCSALSLGSNEMVHHLKQFNPNIVMATSPTIDLGIVKEKRNDLFTIGWIGGYGGGHKEGLINTIFPALEKLNFKFKLILIGITHDEDFNFIKDYFKNCDNIELELPANFEWDNEVVLQNKITSFDIGIATLIDTELIRAKSGIKVKQYLNNGVPALSTNLPENNLVIKDGINGRFCDSSTDFKQRITEFKTMSDKDYATYSKNARASIINFNHDHYYSAFKKILSLKN